MNEQNARDIMINNYIGTSELAAFSGVFPFDALPESEIPFSESALRRRSQTHILIFTPQSKAITLNWFSKKFGRNPEIFEPCMYNQDWYVKEDFANGTLLDGQWHLMQKKVTEEMRAKLPEEIESSLSQEECFPTAITCAFVFFVWYLHTKGEMLWKNDFLWCRDRDHNNDRIYVGRYKDPTGVNKNGFNIHRHLSLRSSYSAAPEISAP